MKLKHQLGVVLRSVLSGVTGNAAAHVAGIVSAFVALGMLGAGMLLSTGVTHATVRWQDGVETIVFVDAAATPETAQQVGAKVRATPGVKDVRYVDEQETLEEFRVMFAGSPQLAQSVDASMLPTSWRVRFAAGTDSERSEEISRQWEGAAGVYQVVTEREAIGAVTAVTKTLKRVLLVIALCVGLAGVLMAFASSRAAAWARRDELAVMRLIGAPRWMVRVPFALQGALEGVLGGVGATAVLWWVARFVQSRAALHEELSIVRNFSIGLWEIFATGAQVTLIGALVGASTAALAVGRYAKATEGTPGGWWRQPVGASRTNANEGEPYALEPLGAEIHQAEMMEGGAHKDELATLPECGLVHEARMPVHAITREELKR